MLQKQNFFISLTEGVDTKADPKQVIPGKLLALENGIFISPKEIQKRNGHVALSLLIQNNFTFNYLNNVPTSLETGNFLAAFNNEIILNDSFNLYSYSTGLANWIYKAKNTICDLAINPVIRNTNSQTLADSAINPLGTQIFAWEDSSGNSRLSIVDTTTNQIIVSNREITAVGGGATVKPKCAYIGNKLIVFYLDTTTNMALYYITYNNGTFSAATLVTSIVNVTYNNYDLITANNFLYVTYNSNANSIKTLYFNANLVLATVLTKTGINANNCLAIFPDLLGNMWVSYADSTTAKVFILNDTLVSTILAPTLLVTQSNIYNITGLGDSGISTIFYDVIGSTDTTGHYSNSIVYFGTMTQTGTASSQFTFLRSTGLQSKAFGVYSNGIYVPHVTVIHDSALQPTYFVCNLYNYITSSIGSNVFAKLAENSGGGVPTKQSSLANINTLSSNLFQTVILQKDLLFTSASSSGTVNSYSQTGISSVSLDFTPTNLNTLTLGQNLHIGSGSLSMYDGATVVEHNFHFYPENVAVSLNTSGGNLTDSSSYGYQVVFEWTDNQGQLHRSAPSPIVSVTTESHSNASQGVVVIPTLRVTAKTNVNIVVYRTAANGTVYYRLNLPPNPLFNLTTANTVTYTDNASDASILANEQLYTTGGEVPNSAAPGSSIFGEYKNRIVLIPSDNPYSWWFSKQVIPGSPVEFSNVFVENIGTEGGPIKAFLQMDSNALFFKENSIFYVVGDGPAPSGANNDFTQALSIASDVGCINSQSLVLTPMGIIFKSNKGIYLLTRGLSLQYIGADVEFFNDNAVTSAQLIVSTNQVRFTLDNNVELMYDYFVSKWSIFTNINAISSITSLNTFSYLQSDGLVLQEQEGLYTDNGNFIKLKIVTSWLSLSGIQGFQRIYKALLLGQYFGPHKLLVQFAYDFNPINTQQVYIDATTALNSNLYGGDPFYGTNSPYGGDYPTYQWRIFPDKQVCEAIQISIEDVPFVGPYTNSQGTIVQASYNESMSLSAISLELGMKKGLNKLPANRSFSR